MDFASKGTGAPLIREESTTMFTAPGVLQRSRNEFRGRCGSWHHDLGTTRRRHGRVPSLESLEERRVPSSYTVVNLGSVGGTAGIDLDINSRGQVVGGSNIANNAAEHAFLFSHGAMTDLGTLGGTRSRAYGINDVGVVVGASTVTPASAQVDLFLVRHGHMTDLGTIDRSSPFGDIKVNNHGDIIGFALADGDAALDRAGKIIDLGSLAGLGSASRALNDHDAVVGFSGVSGSGSSEVVHAFLYKHGKMIDLGTLGGADSVANDINAQGSVVGGALTAGGGEHAFLYHKGQMVDLGTLGGLQSDAGAINDEGEVVGTSLVSASVSHGYLYNHGKMIDLNSLIPANSGFVITAAQDINDRGQIAAQAVSTNPMDSTEYVVLLNPKR
jgi:probable HAF family extracellular repeat protein